MDVTTITQIIDNQGFPILCALALGWFVYKIYIQSTKREERLYSQIDKFGDSLNSFNTTLTKIDARLEVVEKHILDEEE